MNGIIKVKCRIQPTHNKLGLIGKIPEGFAPFSVSLQLGDPPVDLGSAYGEEIMGVKKESLGTACARVASLFRAEKKAATNQIWIFYVLH